MRCVYCGEGGVFIVNDMPESVGCFEHLGVVVEDRMRLDELTEVTVSKAD